MACRKWAAILVTLLTLVFASAALGDAQLQLNEGWAGQELYFGDHLSLSLTGIPDEAKYVALYEVTEEVNTPDEAHPYWGGRRVAYEVSRAVSYNEGQGGWTLFYSAPEVREEDYDHTEELSLTVNLIARYTTVDMYDEETDTWTEGAWSEDIGPVELTFTCKGRMPAPELQLEETYDSRTAVVIPYSAESYVYQIEIWHEDAESGKTISDYEDSPWEKSGVIRLSPRPAGVYYIRACSGTMRGYAGQGEFEGSFTVGTTDLPRDDNYFYKQVDGGVCIIGLYEEYDGQEPLEIPETIAGQNVVSIASYAIRAAAGGSITMPGTLLDIENSAIFGFYPEWDDEGPTATLDLYFPCPHLMPSDQEFYQTIPDEAKVYAYEGSALKSFFWNSENLGDSSPLPVAPDLSQVAVRYVQSEEALDAAMDPDGRYKILRPSKTVRFDFSETTLASADKWIAVSSDEISWLRGDMRSGVVEVNFSFISTDETEVRFLLHTDDGWSRWDWDHDIRLVSSYGRELAAPVIAGEDPLLVPCGEDIVISWEPVENAGNYYWWIRDEELKALRAEGWIKAEESESPAVRIEAGLLPAGDYTFFVEVRANGWDFNRSSLPVTVQPGEQDDFTYETTEIGCWNRASVDAGIYGVSGYTGTATENVQIPRFASNAAAVRAINTGAFSGTSIRSLNLTQNRLTLKSGAFSMTDSLEGLTVGAGVTALPGAFNEANPNLVVHGPAGGIIERMARDAGLQFAATGETLNGAPVIGFSSYEIIIDEYGDYNYLEMTLESGTPGYVIAMDYVNGSLQMITEVSGNSVRDVGDSFEFDPYMISSKIGTHTLVFMTMDTNGNVSALSEPIRIEYKQPDLGVWVPQVITADSEFNISWDYVNDASEYQVSILSGSGEDETTVFSGNTEGTYMTVSSEDCPPVGSYTVRVQAFGYDGEIIKSGTAAFNISIYDAETGYYYTVNPDGTLTLAQAYYDEGADVVLPDTAEIDGQVRTVTKIAAHALSFAARSYTLPAGLAELRGDELNYDEEYLQTLTIPGRGTLVYPDAIGQFPGGDGYTIYTYEDGLAARWAVEKEKNWQALDGSLTDTAVTVDGSVKRGWDLGFGEETIKEIYFFPTVSGGFVFTLSGAEAGETWAAWDLRSDGGEGLITGTVGEDGVCRLDLDIGGGTEEDGFYELNFFSVRHGNGEWSKAAVRGENGGRYDTWMVQVREDAATLDTPVLEGMEDAYGFGDSLTVSFAAVEYAGSYEVTVEKDDDEEFETVSANAEYDGNTEKYTASFDTSEWPAGSYTLRVKAVPDDPAAYEWSRAVQSFILAEKQTLAAPALSPAAQNVVTGTTAEFSFDPVAGAADYEIALKNAADETVTLDPAPAAVLNEADGKLRIAFDTSSLEPGEYTLSVAAKAAQTGIYLDGAAADAALTIVSDPRASIDLTHVPENALSDQTVTLTAGFTAGARRIEWTVDGAAQPQAEIAADAVSAELTQIFTAEAAGTADHPVSVRLWYPNDPGAEITEFDETAGTWFTSGAHAVSVICNGKLDAPSADVAAEGYAYGQDIVLMIEEQTGAAEYVVVTGEGWAISGNTLTYSVTANGKPEPGSMAVTVKAVAAAGYLDSDEAVFTVTVNERPALPDITLNLPEYAEPDETFTLSWTEIEGAQFALIILKEGEEDPAVAQETLTGTSYTVSNGLPAGSYAVTLTASRENYRDSVASAELDVAERPDLDAVELKLPVYNPFTDEDIRLSWSAAEHAESYTLVISGTAIQERLTDGETSYTIPANTLDEGTYTVSLTAAAPGYAASVTRQEMTVRAATEEAPELYLMETGRIYQPGDWVELGIRNASGNQEVYWFYVDGQPKGHYIAEEMDEPGITLDEDLFEGKSEGELTFDVQLRIATSGVLNDTEGYSLSSGTWTQLSEPVELTAEYYGKAPAPTLQSEEVYGSRVPVSIRYSLPKGFWIDDCSIQKLQENGETENLRAGYDVGDGTNEGTIVLFRQYYDEEADDTLQNYSFEPGTYNVSVTATRHGCISSETAEITFRVEESDGIETDDSGISYRTISGGLEVVGTDGPLNGGTLEIPVEPQLDGLSGSVISVAAGSINVVGGGMVKLPVTLRNLAENAFIGSEYSVGDLRIEALCPDLLPESTTIFRYQFEGVTVKTYRGGLIAHMVEDFSNGWRLEYDDTELPAFGGEQIGDILVTAVGTDETPEKNDIDDWLIPQEATKVRIDLSRLGIAADRWFAILNDEHGDEWVKTGSVTGNAFEFDSDELFGYPTMSICLALHTAEGWTKMPDRPLNFAVLYGNTVGTLTIKDGIRTVNAGEDITIEWNAAEHATWYDWQLNGRSENNGDISLHRRVAINKDGELPELKAFIEAGSIPAGDYAFHLRAGADGYDSAWADDVMISIIGSPSDFVIRRDWSEDANALAGYRYFDRYMYGIGGVSEEAKEKAELVIPAVDGSGIVVSAIWPGAFNESAATKLTADVDGLVLPAHVFEGSSITEVVLGPGVAVALDAFAGSSITKVTAPSGGLAEIASRSSAGITFVDSGRTLNDAPVISFADTQLGLLEGELIMPEVMFTSGERGGIAFLLEHDGVTQLKIYRFGYFAEGTDISNAVGELLESCQTGCYTLRFMTQNENGVFSAPGTEIEITVVDLRLAVPTIRISTPVRDGDRVILSWKHVEHAVHYYFEGFIPVRQAVSQGEEAEGTLTNDRFFDLYDEGDCWRMSIQDLKNEWRVFSTDSEDHYLTLENGFFTVTLPEDITYREESAEFTVYASTDGEEPYTDSSDSILFTVWPAGAEELDAPVVALPERAFTDEDLPIEWQAVEDAERYNVQYVVFSADGEELAACSYWIGQDENDNWICTDAEDDSPAGTAAVEGNTFRIPVPAERLQGGSRITVRLTARADGKGMIPSFSDAFEVALTQKQPLPEPTINLPDETVYDHEAFTVSWSAVDGAQSYALTITMDGEEEPVVNETTEQVSFILAGGLEAGSYSLSLIASGEGHLPSEATAALNVTARPQLETAVITLPETNPKADEAFTVSWSAVEDAERYTLTIGEAVKITLENGETSYEVAAGTLAHGTYTVKLKAEAAHHIASEAEAELTIDKAPLTAPVVTAVTTRSDVDAILTWEAVSHAEGYRAAVLLGTKVMYGPVAVDTEPLQVTLPADTILSAGSYAIRVTAEAADYAASEGTAVLTVAVPEKLGRPSLSSVPDEIAQGTAAEIAFQPVAGADGYDILLDDTTNLTLSENGPFIAKFVLPDDLTVGDHTVSVRALAKADKSDLYLDGDAATAAFAVVETQQDDNLTVSVKEEENGEKTASVLKVDENAIDENGTVTIPETVNVSDDPDVTDSATVTELAGNLFQGNEDVQAVALPETVTVIGANALADSGVTSINTENVVTIGSGAFAGTPIQSVDLSSAVTIGENAFMGSGLQTATLTHTEEVGSGAFANTNGLTLTVDTAATLVEPGAFDGAQNLTVVAPAGSIAAVLAEEAGATVRNNNMTLEDAPGIMLSESGSPLPEDDQEITEGSSLGVTVTAEEEAEKTAVLFDGELLVSQIIEETGEHVLRSRAATTQTNVTVDSSLLTIGTHTMRYMAYSGGAWTKLSEEIVITVRAQTALAKPALSDMPEDATDNDSITIKWTMEADSSLIGFELVLIPETGETIIVRPDYEDSSYRFEAGTVPAGTYTVQLIARAQNSVNDGRSRTKRLVVALSQVTVGELTYTSWSGKTEYLAVADATVGATSVTVPQEVDGKTVIAVSALPESVKKLALPKTVRVIEDDAIPQGCEITAPENSPAWLFAKANAKANGYTVKASGEKLATFQLPKALSQLAGSALKGTKAEVVILPAGADLDGGALEDTPVLSVVYDGTAGTIADDAFGGDHLPVTVADQNGFVLK